MATNQSNNEFVDLSGIGNISSGNPYDGLIGVCHDDPHKIQKRYSIHREARNEQQKAKLTAPDFSAVAIDPVLEKLVHPEKYPGFKDERHCLVFWARPPSAVQALIDTLQAKLRTLAPKLWLMPINCLHMTTLEITHSLSDPEIRALAETLRPKVQEITDYPFHHRARLIKPMISYDASAVALTFVPAAGEGDQAADDSYSYHHLRRDVSALCKSTGIEIASRYTVPSAHLTIARFVTQEDFQSDHDEPHLESEDTHSRNAAEVPNGTKTARPTVYNAGKMKLWIDTLEETNKWLREKYWPGGAQSIAPSGEWIVGQEKGLDFRMGTLWYGGGETIRLGKGFSSVDFPAYNSK